MAYATAAQVKAYSALAAIAAKSDSDLTTKYIPRAERLINAYTRQNFNLSASGAILVDGSGSERQPLTQRAVTVSQLRFLIVSDGGATIDSSLVVTDFFKNQGWWLIAGDDQINLRNRIGKNWPSDGLVFPRGKQNIEITGTFGYATVPAEVTDATCLIAEMLIAGEADAHDDVIKEKIGDYSYEVSAKADSVSGLIPAEGKLLLRDYIKPMVLARI